MKTNKVARNVKLMLAAGAAVLALGATQAAQAQGYRAYITDDAPLLSGPSPDYPPVSNIYQNEPVTVYGCLDGYSWCDVQAEDVRGWVDASLLTYPYEGREVPLYDYGYRIGLPIIGFSFNDYWGHYYRDRPFFHDRDRFFHIAPAQRGAIAHFQVRPGFEHRPDFGHRPDFDHRPGFQQGHPEQGRPGFQRGPQPDQHRAAPEQRAPQPQAQQQHMQGPPSHERNVGQGPQPQQRPQMAPQRQAPRPQGGQPPQGGHPQGGHPEGGHPQGGHGEGSHNDQPK